MKSNGTIEQKLEQLADAVGSRDSFVDDVMNRIETAPEQPGQNKAGNTLLRRLLMKRTIKFAAAAVVVIAAVLSLTLFDKTVSKAYALEQTVQACHSVRFIHIRQIQPSHEEDPVMIWAKFFEDGRPQAIRLRLPEWKNGDDGAKEVIWKDHVAEVWLMKKNAVLRVQEERVAQQILVMVQQQDPKHLVQDLMHKEEQGQCVCRINVPPDKSEPITITSVSLPVQNSQLVLYVDQATQLPLRNETYYLKDHAWVLVSTTEFYDYNQPIDPSMFTFDNLPEDVFYMDQVDQPVGFIQGSLTDEEAAVETARRFWQAVIDKEYDTAGRYFEGLPGHIIQQIFRERLPMNVIEIVSVGPAGPHPNPQTGGVIVPCTLKVEKNGQIQEMTFPQLGVRQVYNQPGHWTIFGGL